MLTGRRHLLPESFRPRSRIDLEFWRVESRIQEGGAKPAAGQSHARGITPISLPAYNDYGDLPPGLHRASLSEVIERFDTKSPRRSLLSERLARIYGLVVRTGHLRRFIVFGSFITDKAEPNDVDVFLLMEDSFEVDQTAGETRLLFEHAAAQAYFGASIFWLRRLAVIDSEEAAIHDWQVKRDGGYRGLVEIISE
jgi:hypothetical protein